MHIADPDAGGLTRGGSALAQHRAAWSRLRSAHSTSRTGRRASASASRSGSSAGNRSGSGSAVGRVQTAAPLTSALVGDPLAAYGINRDDFDDEEEDEDYGSEEEEEDEMDQLLEEDEMVEEGDEEEMNDEFAGQDNVQATYGHSQPLQQQPQSVSGPLQPQHQPQPQARIRAGHGDQGENEQDSAQLFQSSTFALALGSRGPMPSPPSTRK
jgi:hypothetical protein